MFSEQPGSVDYNLLLKVDTTVGAWRRKEAEEEEARAGRAQNGPKWPIFGQKWPKMGVPPFWPWPLLAGKSGQKWSGPKWPLAILGPFVCHHVWVSRLQPTGSRRGHSGSPVASGHCHWAGWGRAAYRPHARPCRAALGGLFCRARLGWRGSVMKSTKNALFVLGWKSPGLLDGLQSTFGQKLT